MPYNYGCPQEVVKHERSVRVGRGTVAEDNSQTPKYTAYTPGQIVDTKLTNESARFTQVVL